MLTPMEINKLNRSFWKEQGRRYDRLYKNPDIWAYVLPLIEADAQRSRTAKSPEEHTQIIRNQRSIHEYTEEAYKILGTRPYYRAQRQRAARPRVVLNDGRPLARAIRDLALSAEHSWKGAKELWSDFINMLRVTQHSPREDAKADDIRKWSVEFRYLDRDHTTGYGRFATVVSRSRRQKSR